MIDFGENVIIYEVNLELDPEIVTDFDEWLDGHILQMLQFEGFNSAKKFNSIEGKQYFLTVQYKIESQEDLDRYLRNHAYKMRQEGIQKFQDKFKTHRRIMKIIKSYP